MPTFMTLTEALAHHGRYSGKTWLAAFRRGVEAGWAKMSIDDNPYRKRGWGAGMHNAWHRGWRDAREGRVRPDPGAPAS